MEKFICAYDDDSNEVLKVLRRHTSGYNPEVLH